MRIEGTPAGKAGPFGEMLRRWRRHRGYSQLELAHEAGMSPRHLSFLETGRSNPSRAMIGRLSESLDVPLRERNHLLLSAGYAPAYSERGIDSAQMTQVRRTIDLLLDRHDPYPAYAMDGGWNVLASNRSHRLLVQSLAGNGDTGNVLRLVFDPAMLRPSIVNWEDCATVVLRRLLHQLGTPNPHRELTKTFAQLRSYPDVERLLKSAAEPADSGLFIPVSLRLGGQEVRWMTTILTFGAATDVNLEELVVECFFPADAESEATYAAITRGRIDSRRG
jgi:transcriptional regulator with XRE-family HTH domain